jgi:hypothetical protein
MYKKIIKITGITLLALAGFIATKTNLSSTSNGGNIDLSRMASLNVANAECQYGGFGGGYCLSLAGICVGDPGSQGGCDWG